MLKSQMFRYYEWCTNIQVIKLAFFIDSEPTDIEWKYTEDGKKVRVSVRSGRILPLPAAAEDYYDDFTQISSYKGIICYTWKIVIDQ